MAIWLRKTNPTKWNQKTDQPNFPKPLGISYFCELRLYAKFQLPRLCLSCISMVEEKKKKKNKMIPPTGIATAIKLTLRGSLILLTGQNFSDFFFGKFFSVKKNFWQNFY